ncbi:hypothetical protein C0992_003440 [Termitomyces sp. T32_za158]|nr:hypothetical protein C0992_003440 [Termitomyces sp. T32_za158]
MASEPVKSEASDTFAARKLGLSCAECRRRGCPGICPEGTLAATKGNKVLMAQAQKLTEQVKSLNARVRELEATLALSRTSADRDDGLRSARELLEPDDVDAVSEAVGSLSLGVDGQAKYHGESAGSEYLQDLLPHEETHTPPRYHLNLPDEILSLMNAFPFGFKESPYNNSIFIRYLPHKERAMELTSVYYSSAAWMYEPIAYNDFKDSILDPIYGSEGYPSTEGLHSHRLAVFFMILANGNLYDESQPDAAAVAEQYYALARAAFSLDSILLEVTCATVQALFLVFCFVYNSSQSDKEERWLLTGLTTRIAQTIGLQRDSAAWNLDPQEVQRRRHLFWELFVWESWSSLVHGRPGSLFIQHADCKYPEDLYQVGPVADEGSLGSMDILRVAIPFFREGSKLCRPPSVWNFLCSLYQRANGSYMAFRNGQKQSVPLPTSDEPDELEVVNGRQSVITTKSNPNSPSHVAASPPALHQENVTRSSPTVAQNTITDPSVGYYPLGTSANLMTKPQTDIVMESSIHRFEDHSYSSIGKALHDPLSRDSALTRGVPTSYVTNSPIVGISGEVHSAQPLRDQSVIGTPKAAWNYPISHDCFPQQASPHQPTHSYIPYVHGHDATIQGPQSDNPYGYPQQIQEPTAQNRYEMWMGYA